MTKKLNRKSEQSNVKPKSKGKYFPHLKILDSTLYESSCLSNAAFRVYIMLRVRLNRKTGQLNPTVATIMKDTRLSKKTVERALNELENLGWIFRKPKKGFKKANNYGFPDAALAIKIPNEELSTNEVQTLNHDSPLVGSVKEIDAEYLNRKQLEFPQHNVKEVYADFLSKCGSEKYPKMKPTRRKFDEWLENEHTVISDEEFEKMFSQEK